mgnify:CR=1 FL=1
MSRQHQINTCNVNDLEKKVQEAEAEMDRIEEELIPEIAKIENDLRDIENNIEGIRLSAFPVGETIEVYDCDVYLLVNNKEFVLNRIKLIRLKRKVADTYHYDLSWEPFDLNHVDPQLYLPDGTGALQIRGIPQDIPDDLPPGRTAHLRQIEHSNPYYNRDELFTQNVILAQRPSVYISKYFRLDGGINTQLLWDTGVISWVDRICGFHISYIK